MPTVFASADMPIRTVSEINAIIKERLDTDSNLKDLWVAGEVSNLTQSSAGHIYFTLKDADSALRCVMWRSAAARLVWRPSHGDAVQAHGYVSVYVVQGTLQFYVDELRSLGAGRLHLEFEALKRRLAAEGLFDTARKRRLPRYPVAIGVVTSPTAAAFQDILRVLCQRYPLAHVVLAPTLVQGDQAPAQIVAAVAQLNRQRDVYGIDVIVVARGGGSLEELWAFNDERVARAIANSDVPVVTGIGHEIDFTIADFVADERAPTPTAAAMQVTPDRTQLRQTVDELGAVLLGVLTDRLRMERERLSRQQAALVRAVPRARVARDRQRLDDLTYRARFALERRLALLREQLAGRDARLAGLDPQAVLNRGYAIVRRRDTGTLVTRTHQASAGLELDVRVRDGTFGAVVEARHEP